MNNQQTNLADWSGLIPVLPEAGPRRLALYTAIRRLIESGALLPGTKLPPTRDLASRLQVSRGAAVAAFEMLVADGFVTARVGAGSFVAQQVPRMQPTAAGPKRAEVASGLPLAGTLGVAGYDERSFRQFRGLLNRDLMRPQPAHFHYGDAQGGIALREEVARYLRTARGVRCRAEQIILTSGTQAALDLVARAVLPRGAAVWIEDPCYPMARAVLQGAGVQLIGVPVDRHGLDVAEGERLAPMAKAVYVTPSHQFPLGVTMTMPRRLALLDWAQRSGAWVIEDDYDSEFRYAGPPLTSLQGMDDAERVIYIGTFSKALFPGLRIGYLVLPDELMAPVLSLRGRTDRYPATLVEGALAVFLREGHFAAHLRRARRTVKLARDALVMGLRCGPVVVEVPDQGLHLIAGLPDEMQDRDMLDRAQEVGLGGRALSGLYLSAPKRQGLVLGFSGFAPEALYQAAQRWAEGLAR